MPLRKIDRLAASSAVNPLGMCRKRSIVQRLQKIRIASQIVGSSHRSVPRHESRIRIVAGKRSHNLDHSRNRSTAFRLIHKRVIPMEYKVASRNHILLR